jgi:hypothetical protein
MPGPQLVAVVTAMILFATGGAGQAQQTLAQLQEIERLISLRDCGGLWSYVRANPALMQGDDALARELRTFVESTERGALDCFAARQAAPADILPPTVVRIY